MTPRVALAVAVAAGSCGSSTGNSRSPPSPSLSPSSAESPVPEPFEEGYPQTSKCSMQGQACPADDLPRFGSGLSEQGWANLAARTTTASVRIEGESVQLVDGCQLPGEYVEVVRSDLSAGWLKTSTRLVFRPEEPRGCEQATHVVAAYAIKDGATTGEAIALPLPCPLRGVAKGCIGAGLDATARKAAAQQRFEQARPLLDAHAFREALGPALELNALVPDAPSYAFLAHGLSYLSGTDYGGCSWLTEAEVAAHELDENFSGRMTERAALQHEFQDCWTRPSLATCFADQFIPGPGGNCW